MGLRETVEIRWPSGKKARIAREDYDPKRDTLWEEPAAAAQPVLEAAQEVTPKRRGRRRG